MRTKLLFVVLIGMMMQGHAFSEEEAQTEAVEPDRQCEENCENSEDGNRCYPCKQEEFMIGDRIYRWFVMPSGRRVLRCREVYYDEYCGIYFGPWESAAYFHWYDYYPSYFTYCPILHIYYYNHPHYVWHYHHIYFYVNHHIYPMHIHHWAHFKLHGYWKPWIYWKPWHHRRNNNWHRVSNHAKMVHHSYTPHRVPVNGNTTIGGKYPHGIKPVQQGTSIHKVKPVHNATQVKPMYKAKPVQQGTHIQKAKPVYNATPVKPAYKSNTYIKKSSTAPANQYTVPKTAKPVYVPKNNYNTTTVTRPANNPGRIQTPAARPNIAPRPAANGGANRGGNANNNVRRTQSR